MRIGHGFDVHAFGGEGPIIIGGVRVPYEKGLLAHSDGDVALHALTDALLGAAALGDIGKLFPDTDPAFKGADSRELLREVTDVFLGAAPECSETEKSYFGDIIGKVSVGIKASKMNGKLTLAPGDILRFNKTNNHIDFLNFDPDSYANWIDNDNFFFVEQTLGDIVADLRRHFAVEIVVTDKSLCDETYYASFVNEESLDEILDALNKDRLFSVRREAEVYYISPPLK